MRRFSALRSKTTLFIVFVVISVQITLNLLLLQCDSENQRYTREENIGFPTKRIFSSLSTNEDILAKLQQTEQALLALKHELETNEESQKSKTEKLKRQNSKLLSQLAKFNRLEKIFNAQEFSKIKNKIRQSDFLKGDTVGNYLEVVPFDSFTAGGIYTTNKEMLINRPAMRPLGTRYKEHVEVLRFSLNILNNESGVKEKLTYYNLDNGITRLDRLTGMVYNMYFTGSKPMEYHRVKVRRPFASLELVDSIETVDTSRELINLIIPLSGRTKKLQMFLHRFADICIRWDGRVFLTVVYFGEEGRAETQKLLSDLEMNENFTSYQFISANETFSRGAGLQRGALSWNKGNNIMFFCDVDVYFTADFLERCRMYSEPGKMVYYPIVYSLYNPDIVYDGAPPSIGKQLYIGKDNGYWRDYGFGMTCVYKNDFISTNGFDTSIHGWGMEDIKLYKKFLSMQNLTVVRATDRGIFHLYHPKYCAHSLPQDQYIACLKSKASNEGSHRQMGMLAFGTKLFSNLKPDWKNKLLYKPDFAKRDGNANDKADVLWEKADELDIEAAEIEMLKHRLASVTNFTILDQNISNFEKFDINLLEQLEGSIIKQSDIVKRFAAMVASKSENIHKND